MMEEFEYEFSGQLEVHDYGRMTYNVVYATNEIVNELSLSENPRLRIVGLVAGNSFQGAFQPAGEGRYYIFLSKKFCKSVGLAMGDPIIIQFNVDDQNAVEIPQPLEVAINADQRVRRIWESISAGKKRSFAYRVATAKRAATIENRVEEVIETLLAIKNKN